MNEVILEYCVKNCSTVDLRDQEIRKTYSESMRYLFKNKFGNFTKNEAEFIIYFFAKTASIDMEIDKNLKVSVLAKEEYKSLFGSEEFARCSYFLLPTLEEQSEVYYSEDLVDLLLDDNLENFMLGMRLIFHEIVHIIVKEAIFSSELIDAQVYITALESMAGVVDKNFYNRNYEHLFKENHADKIGLKLAVTAMKKYCPEVASRFDEKSLSMIYKDFDRNFYDSKMVLFGKSDFAMKQLDVAASILVARDPILIEKIPILKYAYKSNGTKKNIKELLYDRKELLQDENQNIEEVNELYRTIANEKEFTTGGLLGINSEIELICDYIYDNFVFDEFTENLLQYRLAKKNISKAKQIEIINGIKFDIWEHNNKRVNIMSNK